MLWVQVRPGDVHADLLPAGETAKTEAWVVLDASTESRIYAGLKPHTTVDDLRRALINWTVANQLEWFTSKSGDAVFLPVWTVHSLRGNAVVFRFSRTAT
jgi:mannose-6-phosphate isomerase